MQVNHNFSAELCEDSLFVSAEWEPRNYCCLSLKSNWNPLQYGVDEPVLCCLFEHNERRAALLQSSSKLTQYPASSGDSVNA